MADDKTLKALQIIAGIQPAWAQWALFLPGAPAKHDKSVHSFRQYQENVSAQVRRAACSYIAERLNEEES